MRRLIAAAEKLAVLTLPPPSSLPNKGVSVTSALDGPLLARAVLTAAVCALAEGGGPSSTSSTSTSTAGRVSTRRTGKLGSAAVNRGGSGIADEDDEDGDDDEMGGDAEAAGISAAHSHHPFSIAQLTGGAYLSWSAWIRGLLEAQLSAAEAKAVEEGRDAASTAPASTSSSSCATTPILLVLQAVPVPLVTQAVTTCLRRWTAEVNNARDAHSPDDFTAIPLLCLLTSVGCCVTPESSRRHERATGQFESSLSTSAADGRSGGDDGGAPSAVTAAAAAAVDFAGLPPQLGKLVRASLARMKTLVLLRSAEEQFPPPPPPPLTVDATGIVTASPAAPSSHLPTSTSSGGGDGGMPCWVLVQAAVGLRRVALEAQLVDVLLVGGVPLPPVLAASLPAILTMGGAGRTDGGSASSNISGNGGRATRFPASAIGSAGGGGAGDVNPSALRDQIMSVTRSAAAYVATVSDAVSSYGVGVELAVNSRPLQQQQQGSPPTAPLSSTIPPNHLSAQPIFPAPAPSPSPSFSVARAHAWLLSAPPAVDECAAVIPHTNSSSRMKQGRKNQPHATAAVTAVGHHPSYTLDQSGQESFAAQWRGAASALASSKKVFACCRADGAPDSNSSGGSGGGVCASPLLGCAVTFEPGWNGPDAAFSAHAGRIVGEALAAVQQHQQQYQQHHQQTQRRVLPSLLEAATALLRQYGNPPPRGSELEAVEALRSEVEKEVAQQQLQQRNGAATAASSEVDMGDTGMLLLTPLRALSARLASTAAAMRGATTSTAPSMMLPPLCQPAVPSSISSALLLTWGLQPAASAGASSSSSLSIAAAGRGVGGATAIGGSMAGARFLAHTRCATPAARLSLLLQFAREDITGASGQAPLPLSAAANAAAAPPSFSSISASTSSAAAGATPPTAPAQAGVKRQRGVHFPDVERGASTAATAGAHVLPPADSSRSARMHAMAGGMAAASAPLVSFPLCASAAGLAEAYSNLIRGGLGGRRRQRRGSAALAAAAMMDADTAVTETL